jgi:hypothetical protein
MGTKISILMILFNIQDFPSVRLPAQGMTYFHRCFRQTIIGVIYIAVTIYSYMQDILAHSPYFEKVKVAYEIVCPSVFPLRVSPTPQFLAHFPYIQKKTRLIEITLLYVCVYPPILTFECLNQTL